MIQRANELHGTFHLEKTVYIKRAAQSRSFREPMQLGSLQFERPPDVQIYLPSFELGKSIPNSAEFGLGLSPKNPRPFLKKGRSKTFNHAYKKPHSKFTYRRTFTWIPQNLMCAMVASSKSRAAIISSSPSFSASLWPLSSLCRS